MSETSKSRLHVLMPPLHTRLKVGRNAWGAPVCLALETSPHFASIAEEALKGVGVRPSKSSELDDVHKFLTGEHVRSSAGRKRGRCTPMLPPIQV